MAEIIGGESVPRILVPALKGTETRCTSIEQQLLGAYTVLFQVELLMKEQPITVRTPLLLKGWVENMSHPLQIATEGHPVR